MLKEQPADYRGKRQCYLCSGWFDYVEQEHIKDASTHPELRYVRSNHGWACHSCNQIKKRAGGV